MPDVLFGAGVDVIIDPPEVPDFRMDPPPVTDVIVLPVGGPKGDPGPVGARYTHTQLAPAATWTIGHNLGAYPDFLFFLDSNPTTPVFTDVTYPDENTAVVTWPSPESGRAES